MHHLQHSLVDPHNVFKRGYGFLEAFADAMHVWHKLQVFVLAMMLHPEVVMKAQAELDSVVGADRMPEFDDREHLPYINAIVKETLRLCSPM